MANSGRPPKYKSGESFYESVMAYFENCEKSYTMPNKAGLCVWTHISRDTYCEYRKKYPDTIKAIDDYIENAWVQRLATTSPTGAIFYLKNAFKEDYRDRIEQDVTSGGEKVQGFQLIPPHDSPNKTDN